MTAARSPEAGAGHQLAEFLRRQRDVLLGQWSAELVDGIAEAGAGADALPSAERHALRRLREGAALREVILEIAGLRKRIVDLWDGEHPSGRPEPAMGLLSQAVDLVIVASSERYLAARDRTLQALDRVSSVAFESRRVDDLLQRLLLVIIEPAAAVDTGSILLRDGDELVVRAAVGLEEELRGEPLRLRIGEGFAGRIAAERRPRLLVGDQIEKEAQSPFLKARGLRALYGVPLQSDGQLVGVAHMGSASVAGFSDQDRSLFERRARASLRGGEAGGRRPPARAGRGLARPAQSPQHDRAGRRRPEGRRPPGRDQGEGDWRHHARRGGPSRGPDSEKPPTRAGSGRARRSGT